MIHEKKKQSKEGGRWGRKRDTHVVVVTMRAILVALLIVGHIFAERLLALFAHERHLRRLPEPVVLALGVALGTVEPLFAARSPDGYLRVQDVFAG